MMKFESLTSKIVAVILAIFIVLTMLYYLGPHLINSNYYKHYFETAFEQYTGRKLVFEGKIKLLFGTRFVIEAKDISIMNPPGSHFPEMAHISQLQFETGFLSLLKHNVKVRRLTADGVHLFLETDGRGQGNWGFLINENHFSSIESDLSLPPIKSLLINDVDLVYYNGISKATTNLKFSMSNLEIDKPLQALHLGTKGEYSDSPITVEGDGKLMNEKKPKIIYIDLKGSVGKINVLVKGTLSKPSEKKWLDLRINANGESTSDFHTLFGLELKPVEHFIVNTNLLAHSRVFVFDAIKARIGGSKFSGVVRLDKRNDPVKTDVLLQLKAYNAGNFLDNMGITNLLQDGKMFLNLSVSTQGKTQPELIKNIQGKIDFLIEDAGLKKWRLHQIAPDFLDSLKTSAGDNIPVNTLDGQISVADGMAHFTHSLLEGQHFIYKITGNVNFIKNDIAMELHSVSPYMQGTQKNKIWKISGDVFQATESQTKQ